MVSLTPPNTGARGDWVSLRTVILLRWLALAGQFVAVMAAAYGLGIDIPVALCLMAISASVAFNLIASVTHRPSARLTEGAAMAALLFDLVQLGLLLFLTGGLTNPFAIFVLAPVTISATALTLPTTVFVGAVAITMISALVFNYHPLTTVEGTVLEMPRIFVVGTWAALVVGIVFLAVYARRVTVEVFEMNQALAATQMALEREQKLTALGGVVAAAAHELGTPLATITLVAGELADEVDDPDLVEDIRLIREQAARCRDILRDMGRSGRDDRLTRSAPISAVVEEAAEPHRKRGKSVHIRLDGGPGCETDDDQPTIPRQAEIIHGIRNLVQNAVDFATANVWIDISCTEETIEISVGDDGLGYPPELLGRIGNPFLRGRGRSAARPHYDGMGLGLFIAKTLLERTGAEIAFRNATGIRGPDSASTPPEMSLPSGAVVTVTWPRKALEIARADLRAPLGRNELNTG